MNELLNMISEMELNDPCDIKDIHNIEDYISHKLPTDYVDFMQLHNGGEGPVGEYGYLAIWDTAEVIDTNIHRKYHIPIRELFYFASDRSGLLYAYNLKTNTNSILELPEDAEDYNEVKEVASNFKEFVRYIHDIDDSEYE